MDRNGANFRAIEALTMNFVMPNWSNCPLREHNCCALETLRRRIYLKDKPNSWALRLLHFRLEPTTRHDCPKMVTGQRKETPPIQVAIEVEVEGPALSANNKRLSGAWRSFQLQISSHSRHESRLESKNRECGHDNFAISLEWMSSDKLKKYMLRP